MCLISCMLNEYNSRVHSFRLYRFVFSTSFDPYPRLRCIQVLASKCTGHLAAVNATVTHSNDICTLILTCSDVSRPTLTLRFAFLSWPAHSPAYHGPLTRTYLWLYRSVEHPKCKFNNLPHFRVICVRAGIWHSHELYWWFRLIFCRQSPLRTRTW